MATYFDATDDYDLALLHSRVRTHAELANVSAQAEADAIRYFRKRRRSTLDRFYLAGVSDEANTELVVYLDGYAADAADADGYDAARSAWTGFARDFRLAIARLISHRLLHYDEQGKEQYESESLDGYSYTRGGASGSVGPVWPKESWWTEPVTDYDLRPPLYTIS